MFTFHYYNEIELSLKRIYPTGRLKKVYEVRNDIKYYNGTFIEVKYMFFFKKWYNVYNVYASYKKNNIEEYEKFDLNDEKTIKNIFGKIK